MCDRCGLCQCANNEREIIREARLVSKKWTPDKTIAIAMH